MLERLLQIGRLRLWHLSRAILAFEQAGQHHLVVLVPVDFIAERVAGGRPPKP